MQNVQLKIVWIGWPKYKYQDMKLRNYELTVLILFSILSRKTILILVVTSRSPYARDWYVITYPNGVIVTMQLHLNG